MIRTLLVLLALASSADARDITFRARGAFDYEGVDPSALCAAIEGATGIKLEARTSTDTVHGYMYTRTTRTEFLVTVSLYEMENAPVPERQTRLLPHPNRAVATLPAALEQRLRAHLAARGQTVSSVEVLKEK